MLGGQNLEVVGYFDTRLGEECWHWLCGLCGLLLLKL